MSARTHKAQVLALTAVAALSPFAQVAHADRVSVPPPPQQPQQQPRQPQQHRFAVPPPSDVEPAPDGSGEVVLDRQTVRAALIQRRAASIAAFRAYEATGVFPSNVYQDGALNVWRDQDGHYCAAATIIYKSGQTDLVARVADQDNNIRLADVSTGPLMDWMLTSGLTQEEVALIQAPFRPVVKRPVREPTQHVAVAPDLRTAETARLAALYKTIDRTLAMQSSTSLDLATTRLLKHPALAWALIDSAQS